MATFLSLPAEIRFQIYEELVSTSRNKHRVRDVYHSYKLHPEIFRVNRQIHHEAKEVFRRQNVFMKVETPWPDAEEHVCEEGRVPVLLKGQAAENFQDVHLSAVIQIHERKYDPAETTTFILCGEDAQAFCRMWFYSDLSYTGLNSKLKLQLDMRNPWPLRYCDPDSALPRSTQSSLLMPFAMVKDLHSVQITGKVDEELKEAYWNDTAIPYDPPETCLIRAAKLKDQGNAAVKLHRYQDALELYEQSFTAMHIPVSGRWRRTWAEPFFDVTLKGSPFHGQEGSMMRMKLRVRLVADIVGVYLNLNNPTEAKFWGRRSIDMLRSYLGPIGQLQHIDFPNSSDWGHIYHRTAVACSALGEQAEARDLIDVAANWLPNDEMVQKERAETVVRCIA